MWEEDKIYVSEGNDFDKTNNSPKCIICNFLNE